MPVNEPTQDYLGNWNHALCPKNGAHKTLLDAVKCQRGIYAERAAQLQKDLEEKTRRLAEYIRNPEPVAVAIAEEAQQRAEAKALKYYQRMEAAENELSHIRRVAAGKPVLNPGDFT